MRPAISFVTLPSRDVSRAKAFYESMGLVASDQSRKDLVLFQLSGVVLAIASRAVMDREIGLRRASTRAATVGVTLSHNVRSASEVQALVEQARRAGGRVVRPSTPTSWGGIAGWFSDPDGHLWEVVFNEAMTLDARGSACLESPDVW